MKKHLLFCVFALASAVALPLSLMAQNAGTKPELPMYRYNSGSTVSPLPVVQGDVLGTIQWRALVTYGDIRSGATIRSVITQPVAPGVLQANMIFQTSGAAGLVDRMIITETGLVGIGTNTPQFNLHTVGNTHTTGRFHGRIHFDVGQPTGLPNTYADEAYFERKSRAALGLAPNAYTDGGILSLAPGGNSLRRQLFTGGTDGLWTRSQDAGGANSWAAWEKLLTSADIGGRPNLTARFLPPGPTSSSLGDGQIFDNGANVVIGGIPPAPAAVAPAFNPADVLTVNGNARVTGSATIDGNTGTNSLNVAANAIVNGATTTGSLSVLTNATVNGDARVNGNVGIGKAPSATFDLDVAGSSNFDGRVKIGATNFPGSASYELAVGGGIIAEEVLVRLQPWPDYVFEADYRLPTLSEVETFIQREKHLPGVTPAREVETSGLNLGQMQKMQMEKIEELYLHLIALEKRIQALEAENAALKAAQQQR
ncbi:MAG: hypothetical protein RMJ33_11025 [Saprospiraceae bacterium]|nr:hypothetical protein [Saprospiraceae bacterium]MDW8230360.1 hypothetical protein [Saprospiraceae bacterium]